MMNQADRLDGLQVARAIAALSVALFHSNLMIQTVPDQFKTLVPVFYAYGGAGVWLFFVISGFIIAKVVTSPRHRTGPYFVRRVFRIYPPYIIITLTALALQFWEGIPFHPNTSQDFIIRSLLIWPVQDGAPFYQVGWTLEYEVIFYLIAGLMAPFVRIEVIAATLFFLGITGILSEVNIYFAIGIMLYAWRSVSASIPWPFLVLAALNFGRIAVTGPVFEIVGYGFGSAALCAALMQIHARNFLWRAAVSLGNISFSIYLVHWAVFRLLWQYRVQNNLPNDDAEIIRWTGILLTILLSYVYFWMVEKPSMELGQRLSSTLPSKAAVRSA